MIKIICLIIMAGCTVAIVWSDIRRKYWEDKVLQELEKREKRTECGKEQEHGICNMK